MRLLAFSDIHRDLNAIDALADRAGDADVLVGAGDFATMRKGLQPVIDAIAALRKPAVLVHGNGESEAELREACGAHPHLTVLHGRHAEIEGLNLFGLGGAVPVTPFGAWSVDMTEDEAARLLEPCPDGAILISHSPPRAHCDADSAGESFGSEAVLACAERTRPSLILCGHIHASWGTTSAIGTTAVYNLGPAGRLIEID